MKASEFFKGERLARSCKGDDCEQNHCPKCGAHTLGYLDTYQQCSSCELEEEFMTSTPKHVFCVMRSDLKEIQIFWGPKQIGTVKEDKEYGFRISFTEAVSLTSLDLEIIQDNWNMFLELLPKEVDNS